jgi:hypothetical protein
MRRWKGIINTTFFPPPVKILERRVNALFTPFM